MSKQLRDMTEPELQALLHQLAERVKWSLPKGTLFLVLAFEQELLGGGITQYVSNCERDDMVQAMKETIQRFETGDFLPRVEFDRSAGAQTDIMRLDRMASAARDAAEALRELDAVSTHEIEQRKGEHPAIRKFTVCMNRVALAGIEVSKIFSDIKGLPGDES